MNKMLISILLALGVAPVQAAPATGLYVSGASAIQTTSGFNGISAVSGEQDFVFGKLMAAEAGTLTFTFLGSEASHSDKFIGTGLASSFSSKAVGNNSFTWQITSPGQINFSFQDVTAGYYAVSNGASVSGWGQSNNANSWQNTFGLKKESDYSYLLLYNDYVNRGDRDYDDMVVRITLAPVPEPETYAMFLAGIGLMGAIARRHRNV